MAKRASWDTCLLKNKQGAYLPCLSNAVAILTHRDEWHNVIAYDAFAGVVVKRKPPPWFEDTAPEVDALGDWNRDDSSRANVWITREYNCPFPTHLIDEAVEVVAKRWVIHPVRDWLTDLTWDRKPRIDDFLIRIGGAADTAYVRAVTKSFFLSAVARILKPGEKVDTVLILEGEQGIGKSTLLRILASDDWFLDSNIDIGSKDGYQILRRKWIGELGELAALGPAGIAKAKQFISAVKDTYRPSYGRQAIDFLRQCVFVGTVNLDGAGYLTDTTGARRFWPVTLHTKIDFKAVRLERAQLWAEAVYRYRKCEPWHLRDPKLLKSAAQETEERRVRDPWETTIRGWLKVHTRTERGVTTEELLTKAVDMALDKQDRTSQMKMAQALRSIGWTIVKRCADGTRRYFPANLDARSTIAKVPAKQAKKRRA